MWGALKPDWAKAACTSHGNSAVASTSAARGAIRASANARTLARSSRYSAGKAKTSNAGTPPAAVIGTLPVCTVERLRDVRLYRRPEGVPNIELPSWDLSPDRDDPRP